MHNPAMTSTRKNKNVVKTITTHMMTISTKAQPSACKPKKYWSPQPVENQLNAESDKWDLGFALESTAFVPDSEGRETSQGVKNRPCREEQLKFDLSE